MAWNSEFRVKGVPADWRHRSFQDAEACKHRVKKMIPDRPHGKKEKGGGRACGRTMERVNHSKGKALERFLESLGGADGFTERTKLLMMDSTKYDGLELVGRWRQEQVEGWEKVGSWRIFHGEFQDAETGEEFDHKGRYIFKKCAETGEMIRVQWEMELSMEDRKMFLPKSHPLYPGGTGKKKPSGGRVLTASAVSDPTIALAAFGRSLKK